MVSIYVSFPGVEFDWSKEPCGVMGISEAIYFLGVEEISGQGLQKLDKRKVY